MEKTRQEKIFSHVVELYLRQAEPVGSKRLCEDFELDCSSATVRAELLELEKKGYLEQPHTSAGRVPTEKGYRYYVERVMEAGDVPQEELQQLRSAWELADDFEEKVKQLAKQLAVFSVSAVIVAYNSHKVYYTGIKNLFSQPEFAHIAPLLTVSQVFDELDERLVVFQETLRHDRADVEVLIGNENPLGNLCSAVASGLPHTEEGLLVVFGPMRMDYGHNINLIKRAKEVISH